MAQPGHQLLPGKGKQKIHKPASCLNISSEGLSSQESCFPHLWPCAVFLCHPGDHFFLRAAKTAEPPKSPGHKSCWASPPELWGGQSLQQQQKAADNSPPLSPPPPTYICSREVTDVTSCKACCDAGHLCWGTATLQEDDGCHKLG